MLSYLPIVAIGIALIQALYYLVLGFRGHLRQRVSGDTSHQKQTAEERGQLDDYESLLALDFVPLGTHWESVGVFGAETDELVFVHRSLPITCVLDQHASGILSIDMTTDDGRGRCIKTTNYDPLELECDTRDLFFQVGCVSRLEHVFEAHVVALDGWEADGFAPVCVESLEEAAEHLRRFFSNRIFRAKLRKVMLVASVGLAFLSLGVPAANVYLIDLFTRDTAYQITTQQGWQIYGALSLYISLSCFWREIKRPNKRKPKKPTYNRVNLGFENPRSDSVGYQPYDFQNAAWRLRHKQIRSVVGLVLVSYFGFLFLGWEGFGVLVAVTVLLVAVFKTAAGQKGLPFMRRLSVNSHHVLIENGSVFGVGPVPRFHTSSYKVPFATVSSFQIEAGLLGSIRLVAELADQNTPLEEWQLEVLGATVGRVSSEACVCLLSSVSGVKHDEILAMRENLQRRLERYEVEAAESRRKEIEWMTKPELVTT